MSVNNDDISTGGLEQSMIAEAKTYLEEAIGLVKAIYHWNNL